MIQLQKNYVITLTEEQAKELYHILQSAKDVGSLDINKEIILVYNDLKGIFDTGIR
jgi:uncharacterized protein YPO0396